jgi:hypothetical protein
MKILPCQLKTVGGFMEDLLMDFISSSASLSVHLIVCVSKSLMEATEVTSWSWGEEECGGRVLYGQLSTLQSFGVVYFWSVSSVALVFISRLISLAAVLFGPPGKYCADKYVLLPIFFSKTFKKTFKIEGLQWKSL